MDIPKYALDAAIDLAGKYGGDTNVQKAFLEGFTLGRESRMKGGKLKPITDEYTFERWWKLYDHKIDRKRCEIKWHNVMTVEERKAATEHTPYYVASTPDKKWRKHPYTYLNNKSWENEVSAACKTQLEEADAEKFMEYFNTMVAGTDIPQLTTMDEYRRKLLNLIYTRRKFDIPKVLRKARESTRLSNIDKEGRRCSFEFIFTEKNFLRILEGYYDD